MQLNAVLGFAQRRKGRKARFFAPFAPLRENFLKCA